MASASGRVAGLFFRNGLGCAAVGTERGLVVNQVRQDDREREPAEVACGGASSPDGTRATVRGNKSRGGSGQVLAASTREVSVASNANVVEKDQMGG